MLILQVCIQYNDIYIRRHPKRGSFDKYTFDGFENIERIYNGVPDWVYEGMYKQM
jgi:hypothetical protein